MKVQCDVCEKAEASVMCCADEAALCAACDCRVHAANQLAGKHQRVNLLSPEPEDLPCCDICQDKSGYFFCLEDRALLCRGCDYSIHATNALAAKHKRFLVSGTRVALHAASLAKDDEGQRRVSSACPISPLLTGEKLNAHEKLEIRKTGTDSLQSAHSKQVMAMAASTEEVMVVIPSNLASVPVNSYNHQIHFNADWEMPPIIGVVHANSMNVGGAMESQKGGTGFGRRNSISEYLTETIPGWRVDELLCLTDAMSTRTFNDRGSSKADVWSYGDADWQADYALEDVTAGQGLAEVPSIPSPPTFSGIPRSLKTLGSGKHVKPSDLECFFEYDDIVPVVPDMGGVMSRSTHSPTTTSQPQKRRRTVLDF